MKPKKQSYFAMPNEALELYRTREISAVDVTVYAALCSLRRELQGVRVSENRVSFGGLGRQCDGVRVSQTRLSQMCGVTPKTIAASVERLYKCGLIRDVIPIIVRQKKKYETSVYCLKPLPESGFFFCPRSVFLHVAHLSPKMFAIFLFMCRTRNSEYGKSWNSYNDICDRLGFGKNQRSEIVKLIKELVNLGLVRKTVRRIKGVFVDNIYRICGFDVSAQSRGKAAKREKRPVSTRAFFKKRLSKATASSTTIIPPRLPKVNPQFEQSGLFFSHEGVGCDFTHNILTKEEREIKREPQGGVVPLSVCFPASRESACLRGLLD